LSETFRGTKKKNVFRAKIKMKDPKLVLGEDIQMLELLRMEKLVVIGRARG